MSAAPSRDDRLDELLVELEASSPNGRLPEPDDVADFVRRQGSSLPLEAAALLGAAVEAAFALDPFDRRRWETLWQATRSAVQESVELARRRRRGVWEEDEFGFDRDLTERIAPLADLAYRHWWRVEALGVERIPATGPGLLVANHAGVVPFDGAVIKLAVLRHAPAKRHVRMLALDWLMRAPVVGPALRATGQTLACPEDARTLLERGELVGVFPEGADGLGKPWSERYRLRRFARGGYVRTALATGAPIVPVAVVGSEEIYPMLADVRPVARLLNVPYAPVTPTFPLLGPLGLVPLPSRWILDFLEPIETAPYGPEAADDRALVLEISDEVRDRIQAAVNRNRRRRGPVFGPRPAWPPPRNGRRRR
jgi:1-acyl-sn-glycerol-3-phosphate acyltransferase